MSEVLTTTTATSDTRDPRLRVIEGLDLSRGQLNVSDEEILANVQHAIRQGHPQLRRQTLTLDQVCLVGGGPSLADTEAELVELVHEGALLVALNGAAEWLLARNLRPGCVVVMDGRASNARFVQRAIPRCQYLLASTCHPDVWAAVQGRPDVWVWHPFPKDSAAGRLLDAYYCEQWESVLAGTTVASRAMVALRLLGHLRFHLFGVDSCYLHDQHHAYPQAENDGDRRFRVRVQPSDSPAGAPWREFVAAPWHLKQVEDFLQILRVNGKQMVLSVHGDGLLAHVLRTLGSTISIDEESHNGRRILEGL